MNPRPHPHLARQRQFRQQFLREANILIRLKHPVELMIQLMQTDYDFDLATNQVTTCPQNKV